MVAFEIELLVVVIGILFDFKVFFIFAVVEIEVFPIGTCGFYHSIFQKVSKNDRKFAVLNFHAPNLYQKKKFVFDSLFGGGNALLNVYWI